MALAARASCARGRWLLGTGMTVLGWPLQILALCSRRWWSCSRRWRRGCWCCCWSASGCSASTPGRREYCAVAAIVAGVVGRRAGAPATPRPRPTSLTMTIVLAVLGAGAP